MRVVLRYTCPLCGEECDYDSTEYVDYGTPDWVCQPCAEAIKELNKDE